MGPSPSLGRDALLLVHAPIGRDARILQDVFQRAQVTSLVCVTLEELCREIEYGAGAMMIAEEALNLPAIQALTNVLKKQESWSDLPLLVLTVGGEPTEVGRQRLTQLEPLGNLTLLERPLRSHTIVSAARAALSARAKQYEVRRRDAELQLVTDNVPVLISYVDRLEVYRRANRTYLEWFGKRPEEVVGRSIREIIGEESYARVRPYVARALQGERVSFESRTRDWNGVVRDVAVTYSPEWAGDQTVRGIVVLVQDVTEQKRNEQALRERERELSTLLSNLPDVVCRFSPNLRFLYVSPAVRNATGLEPAHFLGKTHAEAGIPPNLAERIDDKLREIFTTGTVSTIEFDMAAPGGGTRSYMGIGVPERGPDGQVETILTILRDHTERKRAEAALRESEERFRAAFAEAPIGMLLMSPDGVFLEANRAYLDMLGYTAAEIFGKTSAAITHPDDVEATRQYVLALQEGRGAPVVLEKRYLHKDGQIVWARASSMIQHDACGRPVQLIAVVENITERKRAETALRDSEERFRAAFDRAPIGMVLTTPQGLLAETNQAYRDMTGYSSEELANTVFLALTHPDDLASNQELFARLLRGDIPSYTIEKRFVCKQGRVIWVRATATLRKDSDGRVCEIVGLVEDISEGKGAEVERERLLRELARSNEELSRFAHVAAHDLQSPLRTVKSYTQLLERRLKDQLDESAREFMAIVLDGAGRMGHLIEALLHYAQVGQDEPQRRLVSMEAVVSGAITNLEVLIQETEATVEYANLPTVQGDGMQLLQLAQNLIANAIKYRRLEVWPRIRIAARKLDGHWAFSVQDNGQGIAPQYLEQVFQPLKRLHGSEIPGTGIGLAVCQKIVERHGGRMWVESKVNEGSTFFFTLPTAKEPPPREDKCIN